MQRKYGNPKERENIRHNREESYKLYKKGVLKDVEEWVELKVKMHMAFEMNLDLRWIQHLREHIKVLLNYAPSKYPFIMALDCSILIFCLEFLIEFLIDVTFSIQKNEEVFIEVNLDIYTINKYLTNYQFTVKFFTLFNPYVAIIFVDNKAVQSPLQIDEMFQFFAMVPKSHIASPLNLQQPKVPNLSTYIEKTSAST